MKRRIFTVILVFLIMHIFAISSLAENKTIQLGNTGITCQVDSQYDVITSANKREYSQQIQALIPRDNIILLYSSTDGYYLIYYDQGKDFEKYDFSDKKSDYIKEHYMDYLGVDLSSVGFSDTYDVSVYDSGKAKWLKLDLVEDNYMYYCTIQGDKCVSLMIYPQAIKRISDVEKTIDSFYFGSLSFWSRIKTVIDAISNFGRRILGTPGVIIIWILVGPTLLGIIGYIIAIIIGIIATIFKKRH